MSEGPEGLRSAFPCTPVVSVAASIASALLTTRASGESGAVVEAATGTTLVAFDKTGTLTRGAPAVMSRAVPYLRT